MSKFHILTFLWLVFVGCHSGEYNQAYEYAKHEGRSEVFAKAYAEKIEEGEAKIYAKDYADAIEMAVKNPNFGEKDKTLLAKIYADKRFEGYPAKYAAKYAVQYCTMLPIAKGQGKGEGFAHKFAKHYVDAEARLNDTQPHRSTEYVKHFAQRYAVEMAAGKSMAEAFIAAAKDADSMK